MTVHRYGSGAVAAVLAVGLLGAAAVPASAGAPADCAAALAPAAAASAAEQGFVEQKLSSTVYEQQTETTTLDAVTWGVRWERHYRSATFSQDNETIQSPSGTYERMAESGFTVRLRSPLRAVLAMIGHPTATWSWLGLPYTGPPPPPDLVGYFAALVPDGQPFTSQTSNPDGTATITCAGDAFLQTWTVGTTGRIVGFEQSIVGSKIDARSTTTWTYGPQTVTAPPAASVVPEKTVELGDAAASLRGDMSHLAARIAAGANARAKKDRRVVTTRLIRTYAHGLAVRQPGIPSNIKVHVTASVRGSTITAVNPFTHQSVAYRIRVSYGKAKVSRLH